MTSALAIQQPPQGQIDGSEIEKINAFGLTPQQMKEWEATKSLMIWTCPGFRHLMFSLLTNHEGQYGCVPTTDVPVAATDEKNIMINPGTFFKDYDRLEQVYVIGHEISHVMYRDCSMGRHYASVGYVTCSDGTTLPYNHQTANKAADFRINAVLRDAHIGKPPKDALLDDSIATATTSFIDAYKKVWEDEEAGGKKTGPRGTNKSFDVCLKPGVSAPGQSPLNPQQLMVEIQKAATLEATKAMGHGKGALARMFDEILNPVVPWTDYIRGIFNRKVGSGSFNWKRPNRRMIIHDIYAPSRSGNGAGWIVCWGDTSGSCIADVNKYLPEIRGILEDCTPKRLTVVWCDYDIQRVDELHEAIDLEQVKGDGAPGGGGTSVHPVFEWITQQQEVPEVFIGFTDGYVDFPQQAPPIPNIIWAMLTDVVAPFGETVKINT